MKKGLRRTLAIILALVMILSSGSIQKAAYALSEESTTEESQQISRVTEETIEVGGEKEEDKKSSDQKEDQDDDKKKEKEENKVTKEEDKEENTKGTQESTQGETPSQDQNGVDQDKAPEGDSSAQNPTAEESQEDSQGEKNAEEENTEVTTATKGNEKTEYVYEDKNVKVTARLTDPNAIPDSANLVVTPITSNSNGYDYETYMEALNYSAKNSPEKYTSANTLLYDVAFIDSMKDETGKVKQVELQPQAGLVNVDITFKKDQLTKKLGAKKPTDVEVKHLPLNEEAKEKYNTTKEGQNLAIKDVAVEDVKDEKTNLRGKDEVSFKTKGFSVYAFSYTVDFTYDGYTYSIAGESSILLSKLFDILKIKEDVENVNNVTFSDSDLIKVEETKDDWKLTSLKPFSSNETLTVEMNNGARYVIKVTDDQDDQVTQENMTYTLKFYDRNGTLMPGMPDDIKSKDPYLFAYLENADGNIVGWNITPFDKDDCTATIPDTFSDELWNLNNNVTYDSSVHTLKKRVVQGYVSGGALISVVYGQYSNKWTGISWNGRDQFDGYKFKIDDPEPNVFKMQRDWNKALQVDLSYAGSDTGESSNATIIIRGRGTTTGWHYHKISFNTVSWNEGSGTYPIDEWYLENNLNNPVNDYSDSWEDVEAVLFEGDVSLADAVNSLKNGGNGVPMLAGYLIKSGERQAGEGSINTETGIQTITLPVTLDSTPLDRALTPEEVLGDAHEYGIVADTYKQAGHTETNFAVHHLEFTPVGQNLDIDGSGTGSIPFYAGEVVNGFRFGSGHNVDAYLYMTQEDIKAKTITQDSTSYNVYKIPMSKNDIDNYVDSLIDEVRSTSQDLMTKTTIKPKAVANGKVKIDTTGYPEDTTIYVDCTNITDKIASNDLLIYKKQSQTIVFNIPDSGSVKIGEFFVYTEEYHDGVKSTTAANNGNDALNKKVDKVILSHVFFNIANADSVETNNASALFLAPNADNFKQENGAGWIVCKGTVDSPSEWHFYRHTRYFDDKVGQIKVNKILSDDAPDAAKNKEYSFYVYQTIDGEKIYFYNKNTITDDGSIVTIASSTDPQPLKVTGAGTITLTKLPPGEYVVEENKNGAKIANYSLVVEGEGTRNVGNGSTIVAKITNNYTSNGGTEEKGSLKITKEVSGAYLTAKEKAAISFTVTGPDNFSESKTYGQFTNGVWTITNLTPGKYTVTETGGSKEGYTLNTTFSVSGGKVTVEANQTAEITVTNIYSPQQNEKVSISGSKTWLDGGKDHTNANEVVLTLKRKTNSEDNFSTVTATPEWSGSNYTFSNLDKNDAQGNEYTYDVEEGTITGYASTKQTTQDGKINFTNRSTETVTISGSKTWLDGGKTHDNASEVDLELKRKTKNDTDFTTVSGVSPAWSDDTYTFSDLDKYDAQGNEYTYDVEEQAITGYTTTKQKSQDGQINFTNRSTETVNVSVSKSWVDNNNANNKRPASVTVRLHANDVEVNNSSFNLTAETWSHTWENQPKYDSDGNEITYTVTEDAVADYSPTYDNSANSFTITNTYTPGSTSITVTKSWKDADNAYNTRPHSVSVTLLADGKSSGEPVTLDAEHNWTHTWQNLPIKNDNNEDIVYTVSEDTVDKYNSKISGDAGSGYTITNTLSESISVSGSKTWLDGNQSHTNKNEISLILKRKSEKDGAAEETLQNQTVTWNENNYSFNNLQKYDSEGYKYTYSVSESPVNGYTIEQSGNDFTNIKLIDISGEKIWSDNNNAANKRQKITVKLQKKTGDTWTDVEGKSKEIAANAEGDNLKYSFTGLPQYENNSKVEYRVVETTVPEGYTASGGTSAESYDITNTIKGKEESDLPVVLTVHKKGDQNADLKGAVFTLKDSNNGEHDYTTGDNGKITITFTEPGTWTLRETQAPDGYKLGNQVYTIKIDRSGNPEITYNQKKGVWNWIYNLIFGQEGVTLDDNNTFEVTNDLTEISVSKKAVSGSEELPGATLQILDNDGNVVTVNGVNLEWDSTNSPKTIKGLKTGVNYILRETVAPNGYTVASDISFTLDADGSVKVGEQSVQNNTLLVEDTKTKVKISKVDIANGEELEGARIQILDKDGKVVKINDVDLEWTSTKEAREIVGLKTGVEYTLREIVAPNGYDIATDTSFVLKEDGTIDSSRTTTTVKDGVLLVEDKAKVTAAPAGTLVITKSFDGLKVTDEEKAGSLTFVVQDKDGNYLTKNGNLVKEQKDAIITLTDFTKGSDGRYSFTFKNVPVGDYKVTETNTAIAGYSLNKTLSTTTATAKIDDGNTSTVDLKDVYEKSYSITIRNVDEKNGKILPGAKLKLYKYNEDTKNWEEVEGKEWTSGESDHEINDLLPGKYRLVTTSAPEGYEPVVSHTDFSIDENGKMLDANGNEVANGLLLVQDTQSSTEATTEEDDDDDNDDTSSNDDDDDDDDDTSSNDDDDDDDDDSSSGSGDSSSSGSTRTGDHNPIATWLGIAVTSLLLALGIIFFLKKKED